MISYPDAKVYDELYEKYLTHRPAHVLVNLAGAADLKGKLVWDLCCGKGEITLLCVQMGATVISVDGCMGMVKPLLDNPDYQSAAYQVYVDSIYAFLGAMNHQKKGGSDGNSNYKAPDVVFCRQAVNYWMNDEVVVRRLATCLNPGSLFIFNTFNRFPDLFPKTKEYKIGDHSFVEVSWFVPATNKVHHVQIRDGMEPHVTQFDWISPDRIWRLLSPYFEVKRTDEGPSSTYICTRNSAGFSL